MQRKQVETITLNHPVMPAELVIAGDEIEIRTGKSGSQAQMLLDDVAVILSSALQAGVQARTLVAAFGAATLDNMLKR